MEELVLMIDKHSMNLLNNTGKAPEIVHVLAWIYLFIFSAVHEICLALVVTSEQHSSPFFGRKI